MERFPFTVVVLLPDWLADTFGQDIYIAQVDVHTDDAKLAAEPDEERLAMEAVMASVDPATWPGLTSAQRCALGRFAKPQPAEPVKHDLYKTGDPDVPEQLLDRNGVVVLQCCKRCGKAEAELSWPCETVKVPTDEEIVKAISDMGYALLLRPGKAIITGDEVRKIVHALLSNYGVKE